MKGNIEVEKIFKLSVEYLADYFDAFVTTLRTPGLAFQPIQSGTEKNQLAESSASEAAPSRLNPKLVSFLLINIFIGSTINAKIVGRGQAPDLMLTTVVVIVCWVVFSSLVHVLCKVFRGHGSFVQSLSACLHVFAVIYVLSSCFAFLWGVAVTELGVLGMGIRFPEFMNGFVREPFSTYFLVQLSLTTVYLMLAMKRIHRFMFQRPRHVTANVLLVLSYLELVVFSVMLLMLTFMIVGVSKSTYDVHKIPLKDPEIPTIAPTEVLSQILEPEGSQANSRSRRVGGSRIVVNTDSTDLNTDLIADLWTRYKTTASEEGMKPGNVVFFSGGRHMGIVADEHGFYHMSRSHGLVYSPFNDYWLKRVEGFRRIPNGCRKVLGPSDLGGCPDEQPTDPDPRLPVAVPQLPATAA